MNKNCELKDCLNIIVVGQSGVGKSSFLNYLLGQEVFLAGKGEPVTQTYFEKKELPADEMGVRYIVYDTKGIEPTTTYECKKSILSEIDKKDKETNFFCWIHSVYYCIDATSNRIQDFEVTFIKELEKKVSVIILLTKSDVGKANVLPLTEEIHKRISPICQVIPICSIENVKGTRKNKTPIHQFGREEVLKASFYGLWNKIATLIPERCVAKIRNSLEYFRPSESIKCSTYPFDEDSKKLYARMEERKIYPIDHYLENIWITICSLNTIEKDLNTISATQSKEIYDEVIEFYKKVNRFRPNIFFMTESTNALHQLKTFDKNADEDMLLHACQDIISAKIKLDACVFWDAAEKENLDNAINYYKQSVNNIKARIQERIESFVSTYRGELKQYGLQCINSNTKIQQIDNDLSSLTREEYIYANTIKFMLEKYPTKFRTCRFLLDKFREELKIEELKAGRIEDFIRAKFSD